ncbi:lipase ZK262.3-like [Mercenaria mercenaria]|uniref:lipase ZK262.3-like n=1 Tax=Mercenaria mercenaria TaxID=6596 RepID=UPI00234FAC59|nr:lipase ZK262.3-like [Mercenaria mercenaria]
MFGFYVVFILLIAVHESSSRCSRYKDCHTCASHKTWSNSPCRWCPLDQQCHAKWSPRNHCIRVRVGSRSQCEEKNNGKFSYSPEEAYKLALFSAIAYSDEPAECLIVLFPTSDYTLFSVYVKKCDDFYFEYDKQCMAFVTFSTRNQEIIVAYRGTRGVKQIVDQVLTIIGTPSVPSAVGGKVQMYFNNVHNKFYRDIKYLIQDLMQWFPTYTVKLTGHSLGGTAASITSAMLVKDKVLKPEQILLYTFGMPRVGNKRYALAHDKLVPHSWRVVRSGDAVARLPFCRLATCSLFNGPYHHGTKVLYTESKMNKESNYVVCNGNEDSKSKCMNKSRRKRGAVKNMINRHKFYFNIPIGTYCRDHILNQS